MIYIVARVAPQFEIVSAHRTLEAAMLNVWTLGPDGRCPKDQPITGPSIEEHLDAHPSIRIAYTDGSSAEIQRHVLAV